MTGSRAIQKRKSKVGSVPSVDLRKSPLSTPPVTTSLTGIFGGVSMVREPDTNWRAATATPVRTVLTVAGSRHAASARQVAALAASGVETLQISFEQGHLAPQVTERTIERLLAAFAEGRSATLTTCETPVAALPGHEIANALASLATDPRLLERYDAMILTGGDVAAAVCSKLEAEAIWLGGEALPAIPWGTLHGGLRPGLPIVTKAGSFGDDRAMIESVAFLTQTAS